MNKEENKSEKLEYECIDCCKKDDEMDTCDNCGQPCCCGDYYSGDAYLCVDCGSNWWEEDIGDEKEEDE
jgi:hypothetical protein